MMLKTLETMKSSGELLSPDVPPPSAGWRQQQPLRVMETDNTLDMCFS